MTKSSVMLVLLDTLDAGRVPRGMTIVDLAAACRWPRGSSSGAGRNSAQCAGAHLAPPGVT